MRDEKERMIEWNGRKGRVREERKVKIRDEERRKEKGNERKRVRRRS